MLALHTRGLRVMGALLLPVGAGIAVVGGFRLQPSADAIRNQVREVSLADAFGLTATVWPWIFAFSGVLLAAGAVVTMTTAANWPSGSARIRPGSSKAGVSIRRSVNCGRRWTSGSINCGPHVHNRAAGSTMEDTGRQGARRNGLPGRYVLGMQSISRNEDMADTAQLQI